LAFALWIAPAQAVPLEPGQRYEGGTRLEDHTSGLSLTVPDDWVASLPKGGSVLVLTPDDRSFVLALARRATLDQARLFLAETFPLGNGIVLQPMAAPIQNGEEFAVPYAVTGGTEPYEARGRARRLSNGFFLAVFAVSKPGELETMGQVADQILAGVAVLGSSSTATAQGDAGNGSGDEDDWHSYLMGRHLVHYYSGSGYYEEQHIYLCSNGEFRKSFGGGGYTPYGDDGASGATQSANAGRWHATGTGNYGTLILDFANGGRADIGLEYKNNKVYFDNVQWLRDPNNEYCS